MRDQRRQRSGQRTASPRPGAGAPARLVLLAVAAGLLAGVAPRPVAAGETSEQTIIAPQTVRQALDLATGKQVRLDAGQVRDPRAKAELNLAAVFAMDFGSLCDKTGSVLLGADGSIQDDPDLLYHGGTTQAAEITITGDPNRTVIIDCTSLAADGFTMSDFVSALGVLPVSEQLDGDGILTLTIGARLGLDASQVSAGDDQTVAYTITAIYQ